MPVAARLPPPVPSGFRRRHSRCRCAIPQKAALAQASKVQKGRYMAVNSSGRSNRCTRSGRPRNFLAQAFNFC